MTATIQKEISLSHENLKSILQTGSLCSYVWCSELRYKINKDVPVEKTLISVEECDEDFDAPIKTHNITGLDVEKAVAILFTYPRKTNAALMVKDFINNEYDACYLDAEACDVILQIATFKDVVYG